MSIKDQKEADDLLLGAMVEDVMTGYPSYRLREKSPITFHATDSGKCGRLVTYKKLKVPESNPADLYGKFRMQFGNFTESGLKYAYFNNLKMHANNVSLMSAQGDCGELDFGGVQWTGYRDFDFHLKTENYIIPMITELKVKVGFGAKYMIHLTPFGSKKKVPPLDFNWGYPQQLSLYLRDFYIHCKDQYRWLKEGNPMLGRLVFFLYYDGGGAGFVEYFAKYRPETNDVLFYQVKSHQFPECNSEINEIVKLDDISTKWKELETYIKKGELAPPDFERKYEIDDPRVNEANKTALTAAARNKVVIGDLQCKYCSFRDKCAKDLGVKPSYTKEEVQVLKQKLKNKK